MGVHTPLKRGMRLRASQPAQPTRPAHPPTAQPGGRWWWWRCFFCFIHLCVRFIQMKSGTIVGSKSTGAESKMGQGKSTGAESGMGMGSGGGGGGGGGGSGGGGGGAWRARRARRAWREASRTSQGTSGWNVTCFSNLDRLVSMAARVQDVMRTSITSRPLGVHHVSWKQSAKCCQQMPANGFSVSSQFMTIAAASLELIFIIGGGPWRKPMMTMVSSMLTEPTNERRFEG